MNLHQKRQPDFLPKKNRIQKAVAKSKSGGRQAQREQGTTLESIGGGSSASSSDDDLFGGGGSEDSDDDLFGGGNDDEDGKIKMSSDAVEL